MCARPRGEGERKTHSNSQLKKSINGDNPHYCCRNPPSPRTCVACCVMPALPTENLLFFDQVGADLNSPPPRRRCQFWKVIPKGGQKTTRLRINPQASPHTNPATLNFSGEISSTRRIDTHTTTTDPRSRLPTHAPEFFLTTAPRINTQNPHNLALAAPMDTTEQATFLLNLEEERTKNVTARRRLPGTPAPPAPSCKPSRPTPATRSAGLPPAG